MLIEEKDVSLWRADVQDYNKHRKERGYENPQIEYITQKKIKEREKLFDPVLQVFSVPSLEEADNQKIEAKLINAKKQKIKATEKYLKDFNIVNLEKVEKQGDYNEKERSEGKCTLQPARRDFNIITNNTAELNVLTKQKEKGEKKTDVFNRKREFNIITNKYTENHDNKTEQDVEKVKVALENKYRKTHNYNFVNGQCYYPDDETTFQDQLKVKQQNHGKDASLKLPPSLRFRETVIFDRTRPIPEEIKLIDQQKENAKKRYQLRYAIENEYHERNIESQERSKQRLLNGLCDQKYLDEHKKGFDLITLEKKDVRIIENLINKKPNLSSWDKTQLTRLEGGEQLPLAQETNNLPKIVPYNSLFNTSQNETDIAPYQQSSAQEIQNQATATGFSSTGNARPPRQPRKIKTPPQFEPNDFSIQNENYQTNHHRKNSRGSVGSRGSVISSESNQNKFRIKSGGFNS